MGKFELFENQDVGKIFTKGDMRNHFQRKQIRRKPRMPHGPKV